MRTVKTHWRLIIAYVCILLQKWDKCRGRFSGSFRLQWDTANIYSADYKHISLILHLILIGNFTIFIILITWYPSWHLQTSTPAVPKAYKPLLPSWVYKLLLQLLGSQPSNLSVLWPITFKSRCPEGYKSLLSLHRLTTDYDKSITITANTIIMSDWYTYH